MDKHEDISVSYKDLCKVRDSINKDMRAMFDDVNSALSMLMKTVGDAQDSLEEITKTVTSEIFPVEVRARAHRPASEDENKDYKKGLEKLLSDTFYPPINAFECHDLLMIGFKYYSIRLADDKFYLFTDLPEMLTINHRMHSLIFRAKEIALTVSQKAKSIKAQRLSSKKIKGETWQEITEAIQYLEKDPEAASKYYEATGFYSKSRLCDAINTQIKRIGTTRAIIDYIEDHLGSNATQPKAKYTIPEWMNKLKIISNIGKS